MPTRDEGWHHRRADPAAEGRGVRAELETVPGVMTTVTKRGVHLPFPALRLPTSWRHRRGRSRVNWRPLTTIRGGRLG